MINKKSLLFILIAIQTLSVQAQSLLSYYEGDVFVEPRLLIGDEGDINISWSDVEFLFYRLGHGAERVSVSEIPSREDDISKDIYEVDYTVTDSSGNMSAVLTRTVVIEDGIEPIIEFDLGVESISILMGVEEDLVTLFIGDETNESLFPVTVYDPQLEEDDLIFPYIDYLDIPYEGHYTVDLSDVDNSTAGVYRVNYVAYDNALDDFKVDESHTYSGGVDNRTEKVLLVSVLEVPKWISTQNLEISTTNENGAIILDWDIVIGADGYKVYRCDTYGGTYSLINSIDDENNPNFIDFPGSGCYFYKVSACYEEKETELSDEPVLFNKIYGLVNELTASEGLADRVTLSWNEVVGANGYNIYVIAKKDYSGSNPIDAGRQPVASVSAITFDYMKTRSEGTISDIDVSISSPPGYLYFWVEPYVDPNLHGATGTKLSVGEVDNTPVIGYREVDSDEWISTVLRLMYNCTKELLWSSSRWSDYKNNNSSDEDKINAGFDVAPSGVPNNIPGAFKDGPHVLIQVCGSGRSIVEHVRDSGYWEIPYYYAFSRWWYDNATYADHTIVTGSRRFYKDWNGHGNQINAILNITGLYPGVFNLDWLNTTGNESETGGAHITSGTYKIDRDGGSWTPTSVTHDDLKHYVW